MPSAKASGTDTPIPIKITRIIFPAACINLLSVPPHRQVRKTPTMRRNGFRSTGSFQMTWGFDIWPLGKRLGTSSQLL